MLTLDDYFERVVRTTAINRFGIEAVEEAEKNFMARTPTKKVAPSVTEFHKELLQRLVNGRQQDDAYYEYHPEDVTAPLVSTGDVDINLAMTDENGYYATRASDKAMKENVKVVQFAAPAASKFAIDDGIALPERKRAFGKREATYPFDMLNVGESFHVPATEEKPDPARALGSAVSVANKRWARETGNFETVLVQLYQVDGHGKRIKVDGHFVKDGHKQETRPITEQERKFTIRTVDASDPRGPGARVFRVK